MGVKTLLVVCALVVAAGAAGWFLASGSQHAVSLGEPLPAATTGRPAQLTGSLPSSSSFEVWFAHGGRLVEVLRAHRATPRVATAALRAVLAGPTSAERASGIQTAIPAGTRLVAIAIADGVANVDLTGDFQAGAGSRDLELRLAQVVYTATQFPSVKAVRFKLNGAPLHVLTDSGSVVDRPVGRSAYGSLAPVAEPLAGSWQQLPRPPVGALGSRFAAWTGRELLIVGRSAGKAIAVAYAPARHTWRRLPAPPGLRGPFRGAWTGKDLIVWGPSAVRAYHLGWQPVPAPPVTGTPQLVAWTGRELIGWTANGGAAYRPAQRAWRRLPPAPFTGPAAWTGRELIVVSGSRAAAFRPGTGWRELAPPPEARNGATAVWDGKELLLVGGKNAPATALAYSPATGEWRSLAPMGSGRTGSAVVWTGTRLLLWGGETGVRDALVIPPHGLAYDPKAGRWSPLPQAPLQGRLDPVGVWTGRSLLVWGGDPGFVDGAAFTPADL